MKIKDRERERHTSIAIIINRLRLGPRPSTHRPRPTSINTVPTVPITLRRIACSITIIVFNPIRGTTLDTIGHRPAEIHLPIRKIATCRYYNVDKPFGLHQMWRSHEATPSVQTSHHHSNIGTTYREREREREREGEERREINWWYLLAQSWNAVEMALNSRWAIGWQVRLIEKYLLKIIIIQ